MPNRVPAAVALVLLLGGCFSGRGPDAGQGWTAAQRESWYFATQGSRLMPASWFRALTLPDGSRFADLGNLDRYGFLRPPADAPRDLPIGFTQDRQSDDRLRVSKLRWYAGQSGAEGQAEPWVGINCAACHTAHLTLDGRSHVIDGGPALIDFQGFVEDLDAVLAATRSDPVRWDRFAAEVNDGRDTPANRQLLDAAFGRLLAWQQQTAAMNDTPLRYGAGRLDAVGHILNKVLMFSGAEASDGNPSNAPVSFPFLWDITRQEHVQWNGIARNSRFALPGDSFEYGALGRNTGEVLGVFGEVVVTPQPPGAGDLIHYASSVRAENLVQMELILQDLKAPAWPDDFPAIDATLRAQGEALFADRCARCHLPPAAQQAGRPTERMLPFSDARPADLTDIWMACNAFVYQGPTGPMQGVRDNNGEVMDDTAPVANMLATAVRGALIGQAPALIRAGFQNFLGLRPRPSFEVAPPRPGADPRAADRQTCLEAENEPTLAYKARPLDGIWATAPYLHNGSVASLHELLLPADRRKTQFWVGNREYDPVAVGYVDADPGDGRGFLLRTRDAQGRVIEGNSNAGHDYGAGSLSDADRRALIEYMKSL